MSELNSNTQIKTITVGVRELREVKLYPLSMADQIALPETFIEAFSKFGEIDYENITKDVLKELTQEQTETEKNTKTVKIVVELIKDNIQYILKKTTEDVTLEDITNEQFVEIVDLIFTVNYEGSVGKIKDLVTRVKNLFNPMKA